MLRLLLGIAGIGSLIAGALFGSGQIDVPGQECSRVTIEQILQSRGTYLSDRVRLDNAVVENTPLPIPGDTMFAYFPLNAGLIPMIVLGASIGLFALTFLWMTCRLRRLLGKGVYDTLQLSVWNPLSSKLEYCLWYDESSASKAGGDATAARKNEPGAS